VYVCVLGLIIIYVKIRGEKYDLKFRIKKSSFTIDSF